MSYPFPLCSFTSKHEILSANVTFDVAIGGQPFLKESSTHYWIAQVFLSEKEKDGQARSETLRVRLGNAAPYNCDNDEKCDGWLVNLSSAEKGEHMKSKTTTGVFSTPIYKSDETVSLSFNKSSVSANLTEWNNTFSIPTRGSKKQSLIFNAGCYVYSGEAFDWTPVPCDSNIAFRDLSITLSEPDQDFESKCSHGASVAEFTSTDKKTWKGTQVDLFPAAVL